MKNLIIISLLIISGFIVTSCSSSIAPMTINGVGVSNKLNENTPFGSIVFSENGAGSTFLNQVDQGLTTAFNNARISGYTIRLNYNSYNVYIPYEPCTPSPVYGGMSFKVSSSGGPYDGSIFDQVNTKGVETDPIRLAANYVYRADGKVTLLAAEMVTNFGSESEPSTMIVCPGNDANDGTNNGAEHIIIAYNDYEYYAQTENHVTIPHPLLPKPTGLTANKNKEVNKNLTNKTYIYLVR